MIKHIVMMKLKDFAPDEKTEKAKKLKNDLEQLPGKIEQIKFYEVGLNSSKSPSAFDLILTSVFDNEQTLDEYRIHPEHKKLLDFIKETCEKLAVVDYEV